MSDELRTAMVYTTTNSQQVAFAKSMLKSANIEHIIKNESLQDDAASSYLTASGAEFWVRPEDAEDARRALADLDR